MLVQETIQFRANVRFRKAERLTELKRTETERPRARRRFSQLSQVVQMEDSSKWFRMSSRCERFLMPMNSAALWFVIIPFDHASSTSPV